jgi:hypothetical protein
LHELQVIQLTTLDGRFFPGLLHLRKIAHLYTFDQVIM